MKQPEALKLANALMNYQQCSDEDVDNAAAELRRLHEENKEMSDTSSQIIADNMRLHEANQAMLTALKEIMSWEENDEMTWGPKARAAITKAEQS